MRRDAPSLRFQSSPDPKTGCNHRPAREEVFATLLRVSILTRSEDRVQWFRPVFLRDYFLVSILTRSEDRVQSASPATANVASPFQSSPDPKTGCNAMLSRITPVIIAGFNPHPIRRPGAMSTRRSRPRCSGGFNPHPIRRPGAIIQARHARELLRLFQSSPDPKTGCNSIALPLQPDNNMFQSSPDPKTGCNLFHHRRAVVRLHTFQSSPDPKTGCNGPISDQKGRKGAFSVLSVRSWLNLRCKHYKTWAKLS